MCAVDFKLNKDLTRKCKQCRDSGWMLDFICGDWDWDFCRCGRLPEVKA